MSTHDHHISLTYGGLHVQSVVSGEEWNAPAAGLGGGPQGDRIRAANLLIRALHASQPITTVAGILLMAIDIEADGDGWQTPISDLDMLVITGPVRDRGAAGRRATLLLAAQIARRQIEPPRARRHFMPGPEIDGLWWCARCLRFAQSANEDPADSECVVETSKAAQIRRNREAVARALRSQTAERTREVTAG